MTSTSKDPNSTLRPSSQAPSSHSRSITQRSRLARLGNPRDTGGPAPKRLTWPDHGDRNRSLGTLRRTRTTGANLPFLWPRPRSASRHPGHPQSLHRDRVANSGSPVEGQSHGDSEPDLGTTPDSLPRVISAAGVVVVLPCYRFRDGRGILVAEGRSPKKQGPKQEHRKETREQKQACVAHDSGKEKAKQVSGPEAKNPKQEVSSACLISVLRQPEKQV